MPKLRSALFFSIACTMLLASTAQAQYKWIEANGRIGYGDRLPSHNVKILKSPPTIARTAAGNEAAADTTGDMPYELRNAVRSAPVTLYTTPNCGPCDMARDHLRNRGIPFSEKVVSSTRDVEAFQALGFPSESGLPLVTAGNNREVGYHGLRWDDLLTRSGYPKKSVLPCKNGGLWSPFFLAHCDEPSPPQRRLTSKPLTSGIGRNHCVLHITRRSGRLHLSVALSALIIANRRGASHALHHQTICPDHQLSVTRSLRRRWERQLCRHRH